MPVYIDEIIAEVESQVTETLESQPSPQQQPLSTTEVELTQILDRIRQRQQRLMVD